MGAGARVKGRTILAQRSAGTGTRAFDPPCSGIPGLVPQLCRPKFRIPDRGSPACMSTPDRSKRSSPVAAKGLSVVKPKELTVSLQLDRTMIPVCSCVSSYRR